MINVIPDRGETKNLIIKNSSIEEKEDLQMICGSWVEKTLVEGEAFPDDYILRCLTVGDLPPIPNMD